MYNEYFRELKRIYATRDYSETSYRTPFENLLKAFVQFHNIANTTIIQEGKRKSFGTPDFKVFDKADSPIGYLECKDIDIDLQREKESEQIQRYLSVNGNLVLTNHIDFIFYKNGNIVREIKLIDLNTLLSVRGEWPTNKEFEEYLKAFFFQKPTKISNTKVLSEQLAIRTKELRRIMLQVFRENEKDNPFIKFYDVFNKTIIKDLSQESFADIYAQTIGIGILLLRLSKNENITFDNILSKIPKYIPLLSDFFKNAGFEDWNDNMLWIIDEIFYVVNSMDIKLMKKAMSYKDLSIIEKRSTDFKDPFIHFYELFLNVYDRELKIEKGVFYTPEGAVSFIIRSTDIILRELLKIKDGYLNSKVKVLDFASGTGTFILAIIDHVRQRLFNTNRKGLWDAEIREHLLENIFGFEMLVVPYIISHLRIHEYLESNGFHYSGDRKERAEIYLTNTLKNTKLEKTDFLIHFDEEADLASKAKNEYEIIAIVGNPPYNKKSKNNDKWIIDLVNEYKYVDGKYFEERQNWLRDDYVKFIRFAQWKMSKAQRGVIGIITNHSFLDNLTFRGMRQSLIKDFDQIYILDLHGSVKKKENAPKGKQNQNIFDIEPGVCITFLVKNPKTKKKVVYQDSWGTRGEKLNFLYENDINSIKWQAVKPVKPNYFFVPFPDENFAEYQTFWSVTEIYKKYSLPLMTGNNKITLHYSEAELLNMLLYIDQNSEETIKAKFNIKKDTQNWTVGKAKNEIKSTADHKSRYRWVTYRPFDQRVTFFTGKSSGFHSRPGSITKNMLQPNIGLLLPRQVSRNEYQHAFCTDLIPEMCAISSATKEQNQLFPLYLYPTPSEDSLLPQEGGKELNLTEEFREFIEESYGIKDKLEIIPQYIYAVLYSNYFRRKFNAYLRIDFPRIPFPSDKAIFRKIAKIGERLLALHLLQSAPKKSIGSFNQENPNFRIVKILYKNTSIWINDSTHIDAIPAEVWAYTIGGYKVISSWLENRRKDKKTLSAQDINHLLNICGVIQETIEIQLQLDDLLATCF